MKDYSRKLHVTVSGRWYVGLTIGIGVVAIATGNNSIYAIESLLLSGLILSGILSEQVIVSIEARVRREPAVAKSNVSNGDHVVVSNDTNRHIFCIEIGEWLPDGPGVKDQYVPIAWISHLKPRETLTVKSFRTYPKRGVHKWEAIAVATRYPFGFARKIRFELTPGERLVWPPILESKNNSLRELQQNQKQAGTVLQQNEVRPMLMDDDYRAVVWTLSSKALDLVVRTRKSKVQAPEIYLDVRGATGEEFERRITEAALSFYHFNDDYSGTLILIESTGKKVFHGKNVILNRLAVLQPEEPNSRAAS